ncbi:MAG TPA: aminopeptidase P N-terminal domain-containing protein [Candidatus Binataceae bacterium]|jgi:Xaa-Pro aminopeptidase|nr:aminopeptidase P N-terminal domain-containing protein [Candidatus Binataceae bacterium]
MAVGAVGGASSNGRGAIFKQRRAAFMAAIGDALAVLPSAPVAIRSNDVEFVYRQDSDFYYLTGFTEPESVALFAPGNRDGEFILFVRPRDRDRETWTGRRAGVEGAMLDYGADKAYTIDELDRVLPRYIERAERVYYPLGNNERMNARMIEAVRGAQAMRPRTGSGPIAMLDPRELIHEARLRKRPEELDAMRRAAAISAEAHKAAMRRARGGMMEWQIEALVDYEFRSRGAAGPSYPSIIASGPNAAILHYIHNDRRMDGGELLLIDAGCEYDFYAADVTRTFPVGARFSPLQRDLYSIVLEAQRRGIEAVKPGARFDEVHDAALRVLVDGMIRMGLVKGPLDDAIKNAAYRRYYMHRTSHWLGMDVHDVGLYRVGGGSRVLEPRMVLTVEPGFYVAADDENAPEHMRGMGIRIEDDVLVTDDGHEVLTAATPKTIDEIEALTSG